MKKNTWIALLLVVVMATSFTTQAASKLVERMECLKAAEVNFNACLQTAEGVAELFGCEMMRSFERGMCAVEWLVGSATGG